MLIGVETESGLLSVTTVETIVAIGSYIRVQSLIVRFYDDVTFPIRKDQFCPHLHCREDMTGKKSDRDYM